MWPRVSPEKEPEVLKTERDYYNILCGFSGKDVSHHLLELTGNLNVKAGALLTHVSVMIIASTTIAISNSEKVWFLKLWFEFEIVAYLIICVIVLQSVGITDRNTFVNCKSLPKRRKGEVVTETMKAEAEAEAEKAKDTMMLVVHERRVPYVLAHKLTVYLTILLVLGVVVEYLYGLVFGPVNGP
jgi:hypothetical protein